MTVTYRPPFRGEAAALAALARQTFIDTFGHLYRPEDLKAFLDEHKTESAWIRALSDSHNRVRVAEENGSLVGYAKVGLVPSLDYECDDARVTELKELYVTKSHLGAGIAPVLMDWALDLARANRADEMILSVWSENIRAQRFYHRYGFTKVADTFFMVGSHRDDEYLYMKPMRQR